jgi:hypothetical protein
MIFNAYFYIYRLIPQLLMALYGDQGLNEEEVMVFGEKEEFLERHRFSTKFDSSRPLKHLWRNLKDEGIGRQACGQTAMFSPNKFNLQFTSTAAGFAFSCVEEAVVFNAIMSIKSGAVGADDFSIKFIRIGLLHILSVLTHLFNFVIISSSFLVFGLEDCNCSPPP